MGRLEVWHPALLISLVMLDKFDGLVRITNIISPKEPVLHFNAKQQSLLQALQLLRSTGDLSLLYKWSWFYWTYLSVLYTPPLLQLHCHNFLLCISVKISVLKLTADELEYFTEPVLKLKSCNQHHSRERLKLHVPGATGKWVNPGVIPGEKLCVSVG